MAFTAYTVNDKIWFEPGNAVDRQIQKRIRARFLVWPILDMVLTYVGEQIGQDLSDLLDDSAADPWQEVYFAVGQNYNFRPNALFHWHTVQNRLWILVEDWPKITDDPLPPPPP